MLTDGKIIAWDESKGFGFAATPKGRQDVFIHISDFEHSIFRPCIDQQISFILVKTAGDKRRGEAIVFRGEGLEKKTHSLSRWLSLPLFGFSACLYFAVQTQRLPMLVALYYGVLSLITFYLYATDKRAAQTNAWRVSESCLHCFSLLGGWPGGWFAQRFLRHKSKKMRFKWVFYATVLANLAALSWLFTEAGSLLAYSWAINAKFFVMSLGVFDFIQLWWWKLSYWLGNLSA